MGFADEIEKSMSRVKKLLEQQTLELEAESEGVTSDGYTCSIQNEIDETARTIEELSLQLKANEDLKQQLLSKVAEKKRKLDQVSADLKSKEDENTKDEQSLSDLKARKLHASAGISEKDALIKEKLLNNVTALVSMTGVNFTPSEGYIVNFVTKKAKFFQVKGVPKKAVTETIWNAIESTLNP